MGDEQRPAPEDENGATEPGKSREPDETSELSEPSQAADADATTHIRPGAIAPEESAAAWQGRAEVPPPPAAETAPYGYDPQHPPRTWWTPILLGLLALALVALIVLGAWLALRDRSPSPLPTGGPTATHATVPPTTAGATSAAPSASPSPSTVAVPPNLVGMTQQEATAELTKAGLNYRVEFEVSETVPDGIVLRTDPVPGTVVPVRSTVLLVLSYQQPQPSASAQPSAEPTPTVPPTEGELLPLPASMSHDDQPRQGQAKSNHSR